MSDPYEAVAWIRSRKGVDSLCNEKICKEYNEMFQPEKPVTFELFQRFWSDLHA